MADKQRPPRRGGSGPVAVRSAAPGRPGGRPPARAPDRLPPPDLPELATTLARVPLELARVALTVARLLAERAIERMPRP